MQLGSPEAVLDEMFWQRACELRVAIPAIVVNFDTATQTVTVQPAIQENIKQNGIVVPTNLPQLSKVVLGMMRFGGFSIVATPVSGDEGWVVFADMCIDGWWQQGVSGVPSQTTPQQPAMPNQVERRRHDLSDGMFLPMGWSQPRLLASYPAAGTIQIRTDDGNKLISIAAAGGITINAGGDPVSIFCDATTIHGDVVITGSLSVDGTASIDGTPFATHVHSGVTTGASDTGPVV